MGHEDREKKFEQALTRHLRAQSDSAQTPKGDFIEGQPEGCLDVDTLAALHERSLSSEEIRAAQQHVAECARCRDILESLKATDEVELSADQTETKANRESVLSTGGLYTDYASRENPYRTPWPKNTKAPTDISISQKKNIGAQIYATVTLLAAGIVLFIAISGHKPFSPYAEKPIEVAQSQDANEEFAQRRSQLSRPAPPPEGNVYRDRLKQVPENKNKGSATSIERDESPSSHPGEGGVAGDIPGDAPPGTIGTVTGAYNLRLKSQAQSTKKEPSKVPASSESRGRTATGRTATQAGESSGDEKRDLPTTDRNQFTALERNDRSNSTPNRETADEQNLRKEQSRQSNAASAARSAASAGASDSTSAKDPAAPARASSNAPTSAAAPATVQQNTTSLQTASRANRAAMLVTGPDGTILWRLLNGKIDRSVDGGLSWRRQDSGNSAELLSGSAPSNAVCWVVGRKGTILRTTDGGGHWSKLVSPVAGDISDIRAADAMRATIFAATGAGKFATSDGGATWNPAKE